MFSSEYGARQMENSEGASFVMHINKLVVSGY